MFSPKMAYSFPSACPLKCFICLYAPDPVHGPGLGSVSTVHFVISTQLFLKT